MSGHPVKEHGPHFFRKNFYFLITLQSQGWNQGFSHQLQTANHPVCLSACARLRRNRAPCPKRAICASAGVRANPEIRRDPASCANRHVSVQSARLRPRTRARMASLVAFGCPLRTYGLVPADGSQSSLSPRVHPRRDTSSRDTASSSRLRLNGAVRRTGLTPSAQLDTCVLADILTTVFL